VGAECTGVKAVIVPETVRDHAVPAEIRTGALSAGHSSIDPIKVITTVVVADTGFVIVTPERFRGTLATSRRGFTG
jgi:hypothetical protein